MSTTIAEHLQENIDDYTLKTDEEIKNILIEQGSGHTEFHTIDVERLLREKQQLEKDKINPYWSFDCWDRKGTMQDITIEALNKENAILIFKVKHEDLGFDEPYQ